MNTYKQLTVQILAACSQGAADLRSFDDLNKRLHSGIATEEKDRLINGAASTAASWNQKCVELLRTSGLEIELLQYGQVSAPPIAQEGYNFKLNGIRGAVSARVDFLARLAAGIETKQTSKMLVRIAVDDLDNFEKVRSIRADDVNGFAESAFLEDDVEEEFLGSIGEPYKELDSGAETRDLFTDRLSYQGKRLSTAVMFKGRGLRGPLSLRDCGDKGSQLLKLAKNNAAECFIVQHVNKIEPDVKETLIDLVLMNTRYPTVYVGFIDGVDTARFLQSRGKDLAALSKKRTVSKVS